MKYLTLWSEERRVKFEHYHAGIIKNTWDTYTNLCLDWWECLPYRNRKWVYSKYNDVQVQRAYSWQEKQILWDTVDRSWGYCFNHLRSSESILLNFLHGYKFNHNIIAFDQRNFTSRQDKRAIAIIWCWIYTSTVITMNKMRLSCLCNVLKWYQDSQDEVYPDTT